MVMLLIFFVIGASIYFVLTRFKPDTSSELIFSPSPAASSQAGLNFVINNPSPSPSLFLDNGQSTPTLKPQPKAIASPAPLELPLEKNKYLSKFPGILKPEIIQNKEAVIVTGKGNIVIQIFPEAPQAASNFMILAANGFYNNLTFHRVEDWVIQGGDPSGNGTGGPGYTFADEQVTRQYTKGIVAMANAGPNTNGSQFFILKKDYPLPPKYTIFGGVIAGGDVVDKIVPGDIMQKVTIQNL